MNLGTSISFAHRSGHRLFQRLSPQKRFLSGHRRLATIALTAIIAVFAPECRAVDVLYPCGHTDVTGVADQWSAPVPVILAGGCFNSLGGVLPRGAYVMPGGRYVGGWRESGTIYVMAGGACDFSKVTRNLASIIYESGATVTPAGLGVEWPEMRILSSFDLRAGSLGESTTTAGVKLEATP